MNSSIIASIEQMTTNGNRLELPAAQLDNYAAVKRVLLKAGGKYRKCGFDFPVSAESIKLRLLGGEAIDPKKQYQAFYSPPPLAKRLVKLAQIEPHHRAAEPSAGHADILKEITAIASNYLAVELNPDSVKVLENQGYQVLQADFLTLQRVDVGRFDRIVANPPFSKNQDVDHIQHMHSLLAPAGRLVSVASTSWQRGQQNKHKAFRQWLKTNQAEIIELQAGTFKESGTNVPAVIVILDKPAKKICRSSFEQLSLLTA